MSYRFAIITASDTRTRAEDSAGAFLADAVRSHDNWELISHVVVKDERAQISEAIVDAADTMQANIVLTCGGTGLSLRDVTPEATADVCNRAVPGIAEAIRAGSMLHTKRAMLSRAVCMQRNATLVINFPGSERAARECWEVVEDQLDHAMQMTAGGGH